MTPAQFKYKFTPRKPLVESVLQQVRDEIATWPDNCKLEDLGSFNCELGKSQNRVYQNVITDKYNQVWVPILRKKSYGNLDNGKQKLYRTKECVLDWKVTDKTVNTDTPIEMNHLILSFDNGGFWEVENLDFSVYHSDLQFYWQCDDGWACVIAFD